ncbi:GFA family protein [Devosia neptuniae]|uniref:GFA family protein n=1 Tax=Devosia TaxID=46913 RepID=UPI0022AFB4E7|nr:GFA family protein [Devosia neptuniae]MCZ4345918.1 GFA family protein [Devosia neptuniae]
MSVISSPLGQTSFAKVSLKGKNLALARSGTACQPHAMSKPKKPIIHVNAACACGATEMSINGPCVSMFMCSCLDCQRATGTGHSTIALVPAGAFGLAGKAKAFDRPSDSGATFTRHFCPDCGTPLYGQSSRAPDIRMIPVGFFAGQNDWYAPNQLIFSRSQQVWDLVADHLPRHVTYREGSGS